MKDRAKAENLVGETAELRFRDGAVLRQPAAQLPVRRREHLDHGEGRDDARRSRARPPRPPERAPRPRPAADRSRAPRCRRRPRRATPPGARTIATAPIVGALRREHADDCRPPRPPRRPSTAATSAASTPAASTPVERRAHDRRGHHAHDDPADHHHRAAATFPGCATLIKQSPPDTDAAQEVVLPDRTQPVVLRARAGDRHRQEHRLGETSSTTRRRRSGSTNVHFKNNDFLTKIAGPLVGKQVAIELDGVVQSAPVDQSRHHRPRRRDHRQLHAGPGQPARARAALRRAAGAVRPAEADGRERVADARQGPAHRRHRVGPHRARARRALHAVLLPAARAGRDRRARAHRDAVLRRRCRTCRARTASR